MQEEENLAEIKLGVSVLSTACLPNNLDPGSQLKIGEKKKNEEKKKKKEC